MVDQRPFLDVRELPGGFSIPEEKWREIVFVGALRPVGELFVRDPSRPFPPFGVLNLFPLGVGFRVDMEAGWAVLRVERLGLEPALAEEPCLATSALAQRLERAEAALARVAVQALGARDPMLGAACMDVGRGTASFLGVGSPFNRAIALGLGGPEDGGTLERIETFFQERGARPVVAVSPLAHASLLGDLRSQGWRLTAVANVLWRALSPGDFFAPRALGVRVEAAEAAGRLSWTEIVTPALAGLHGVPDAEARSAAHVLFDALSVAEAAGGPFLARTEERAVGAAGLFLTEGLATLVGDATRPADRRRSVHAALLHVRLEKARDAGCCLAAATVAPGGAAQRNLERLDFRVAYTRLQFEAPT